METIQKFKKIGEPKQTSTEKQHKDKYMITRDNFFLWKDNLQFFPIPAQSKKTRDNFFIWEDNLQLFFFMLAQSQREGRTSTSHNKQRKSCVNTSHDFMLAQITINKGY
jgi:hypothetical protein